MTTLMNTITNNTNMQNFTPSKEQQQSIPSNQHGYSDSCSDDQDDVYYSDTSSRSSVASEHRGYGIAVGSFETPRKSLYEDNLGRVVNVRSERETTGSALNFSLTPPEHYSLQQSPSPPLAQSSRDGTTDIESDSSSAYSNESEYMDNDSFSDNQIHGDTSISATLATTTTSTLSGNGDIGSMSSTSLSSSLDGNSLADGPSGTFLDYSIPPTSTRATTPTSSDEWDYKFSVAQPSPLNDEDSNADENQPVQYLAPTSRNTSLHLSDISASDLNEISLHEESVSADIDTTPLDSNEPSTSILKVNTTNIPTTAPTFSPASHSPSQRASIDTATIPPTMSPSKSSTTRRIVSGLWSPFKSTTMPSSKKVTRPSANFAERQKRQSRPPSCVLPGFQESLLSQMEQNNGGDRLKRQSRVLTTTITNKDIPTNNYSCINKDIKTTKDTATHKDDYDWEFWASVICDQDLKNKNVSNQVHNGIPPSLRGTVWQLLSKSGRLMEEQHYMDLLRTTSPYDKMIQRDLARTFPNHKYFKEKGGVGQEAMYNVVRAYSIYDPEVGYCQGLAFIVGPLLLNMPDEEAICVLIRLMSHYGLRSHFTPNMEGLHLRLYQFESLVSEHLPHISRHLKHHEINPSMFASQWFMTLFAYKFPLNLVFRIYDMIFVEGLDTVLLKFALALLKRNEAHLLELDFEPLLNFLKNDLLEEYKDDEQQLIKDTSEWKISLKQLAQLGKEHKTRMANDEHNAKVLESLQKHQAILRYQVDQLNQSTTATQKEYQDVQSQLQDSRHQRQQMEDEQISLKTMVESLRTETAAIPSKVEASFSTEFDNLCDENTQLNQRNAHLEDQLAAMEALLIDIKMRYAQSQDEGDDLSKRLFELKKVMG